jgi:hypothetical protein
MLAEFGDHWVFATERNARIHNLNHQVNIGHGFFDYTAGLVHMPGIPLDCHNLKLK